MTNELAAGKIGQDKDRYGADIGEEAGPLAGSLLDIAHAVSDSPL